MSHVATAPRYALARRTHFIGNKCAFSRFYPILNCIVLSVLEQMSPRRIQSKALPNRLDEGSHRLQYGINSDRIVKRGSYPSSGSILTAAACRTKPGGRPCLERISNQPSRESTTLIFIPGLMLAISREVSLGSL